MLFPAAEVWYGEFDANRSRRVRFSGAPLRATNYLSLWETRPGHIGSKRRPTLGRLRGKGVLTTRPLRQRQGNLQSRVSSSRWKNQTTRSLATPPVQPGSSANTAKVMVSSEPSGADVYVDGNFMGNTPSQIQLAAGSHNVRIEAKDHTPWSRVIALTADSKVTIQAVLGAER